MDDMKTVIKIHQLDSEIKKVEILEEEFRLQHAKWKSKLDALRKQRDREYNKLPDCLKSGT